MDDTIPVTNYKETLNLPKTKFSMKANLSQREPDMLKHWQTIGLYQQIREQRQGQKQYILHDGPPYANGDIHIGHAVNKILKDIIIKSQTLSGLDAPYRPGWDCHGLPIELQVEKKGGRIESASDFRHACRKYAGKQVNRQKKDFQRLGVLGEWDQPYLTMDYSSEANIVRALGKIIANGHVSKGSKPVHWCTHCGSALAEAEVEHENKTSLAIDVRFQVVDTAAMLAACKVPETTGEGPISVVIWTTTPWTLPANQAVSLNPKFTYSLLQVNTEHGPERLLLAEDLVSSAMSRYAFKNPQTIAHVQGEALEHLRLQHPFYARQVPIILGEHVTTEAGTGAVHTAPGHGQDDYVVGMKYNLPIDNPVDDNGKFVAGTALFEGQHVFAANEQVVEVLKTQRALVCLEKIHHSYPHCWRHKTPIIFRATPQWFISMDKNGLRDQALAAIQSVQWMPDWGLERIKGMLSNRPDWCISRQRLWGVPIPLFVHKSSGELHPDTDKLIEQVAQTIEKGGVQAWYDLPSQSLLKADEDDYERVSDTLDVWLDSGLTHFFVLEQVAHLSAPADLYLEGSDQHRGWFQSSLLTSIAISHRAPYKAVLTHGFTVDANGEKMSKSKGNVVSPQDVMKTLGADIIRLWVSSTDYSNEMSISDEILKRTADAYRRIRNTTRFLLSNLHGFEPQQHLVNPDEMLAIDRWAVDRALRIQQELQQDYDTYQFHLVYQKIHQFCVMDMGSFYLDIIKDRQYTMQTDSLGRRSAQTALYHLVSALVRWIAPILSFTADEIWRHIPGDKKDSVLLEQWYDGLFALAASDKLDADYWQTVLHVKTAVNKVIESMRGDGLGSSLKAQVTLYCQTPLYEDLMRLGDELRFAIITSTANVVLAQSQPENAVDTAVDGLWLHVEASTQTKCTRCWHYHADVGRHEVHPELCQRCIDNVDGPGEQRAFV